MFWVPLAGGVEELLPGAEVPEGHSSITRDLRPHLLILYHQHLHHHQAHRVLQAGVSVDLSCHRHQSQNIVLDRGWRHHFSEDNNSLANATLRVRETVL